MGSRLLWVAVGLGIALLASVFFHRFDPARERIGGRKVGKRSGMAADDPALEARPAQAALGHTVLTALDGRAHGRFARLVLSELTLMAKGLRWWWYVVAAGLLVAEFVVSYGAGPGRGAAGGVDMAGAGVVADGLP